ncbi:uncharacterized protein [Eurosta solidaginis]|uniref:uncharacterized protein isoform X2 n=1 Tax=Eurosta solidaginis TaxID=178769 RepID=UPI003531363A
MDSLAEAYSSINNDHEYINGDVEIMENSEVVEYIVEEAQIVEEREEPNIFDSDEYTQTGRKRLWSKPAVKLMLCLVEDILPDVGTTTKMPTKAEMYKYVAKEMRKEGYSFTGPQVENKFRGIEKTYKRKKMQLTTTASEALAKPPSSKKKRKADATSESDESKSDTEVVWMRCNEPSNPDRAEFKVEPNTSPRAASPQADLLERTTEGDFPSTATNRKDNISARPLLRIFTKMAHERRRYHTKVLEYLKEKERRGRQREERDQKKLELLERVIRQNT